MELTVRPIRPTPTLLIGSVAVVVLAGWLTGALLRWWEAPLVGWLQLPVLGLVTIWECWQAAGAPSQRLSALTLACFMSASAVTQWGLLRLPGARVLQRGGVLQLTLDSAAVMVTVAVFAWHFSFRHGEAWNAVAGPVWPARPASMPASCCAGADVAMYAAKDRGKHRPLHR